MIPLLATRSFRTRLLATTALASAAVALATGGAGAAGGMQGGTVVGGAATISTSGNTTTVTTSSSRTIINWQAFSIGANEAAKFVQPTSASAVLNRVTGGQMSQLLGSLTSNGAVYLINPSGVVVGGGAVINTNGFLASTLDVSNAQFMAGGDLNFIGNSGASIRTDKGSLIKADAGDVILIARQIEVHGTVEAKNGTVGLGAGTDVLLKEKGAPGDRLFVRANVGDKVSGNAIDNSGVIEAASAELKAAGGNLYALAINNTGVVRATGVEQGPDGSIRLVASDGGTVSTSGALVARKANGAGGSITVDSGKGGTTLVAGVVDASGGAGTGTKGGSVDLFGDKVALLDTGRVDVSGDAGGGSVRMGGDFQGANPDVQNSSFTLMAPGGQIAADARVSGDGGRVIIWADQGAAYYGTVTAKGGAQSGNGGFVEVSGLNSLDFRGWVDTSAANGAFGTLLLDPTNITVVTGAVTVDADWADGGNIWTFAEDTGSKSIGVDNINTLLTSNNFEMQATKTITWNADAALTYSGANERTLTLTAGTILSNGTITFNGSIDTSSAKLNVVMSSDDITLASGSSIKTKGGSVSLTGRDDVQIDGSIASLSGKVSVSAGDNLKMAGGKIETTTGNISLLAKGESNLIGDAEGGRVELDATSTIASTSGNIDITAQGGATGFGDAEGGVIENAGTVTTKGDATIAFTVGGGQTLAGTDGGEALGGSITNTGTIQVFAAEGSGNTGSVTLLAKGGEALFGTATGGLIDQPGSTIKTVDGNIFVTAEGGKAGFGAAGGIVTNGATAEIVSQGGNITILAGGGTSGLEFALGGFVGNDGLIETGGTGAISIEAGGGNILINGAAEGGAIVTRGVVRTLGGGGINLLARGGEALTGTAGGGGIEQTDLNDTSDTGIRTASGEIALEARGGKVGLGGAGDSADGGAIFIGVDTDVTSEGGNIGLTAGGAEVLFSIAGVLGTEGSVAGGGTIEIEGRVETKGAGNVSLLAGGGQTFGLDGIAGGGKIVNHGEIGVTGDGATGAVDLLAEGGVAPFGEGMGGEFVQPGSAIFTVFGDILVESLGGIGVIAAGGSIVEGGGFITSIFGDVTLHAGGGLGLIAGGGGDITIVSGLLGSAFGDLSVLADGGAGLALGGGGKVTVLGGLIGSGAGTVNFLATGGIGAAGLGGRIDVFGGLIADIGGDLNITATGGGGILGAGGNVLLAGGLIGNVFGDLNVTALGGIGLGADGGTIVHDGTIAGTVLGDVNYYAGGGGGLLGGLGGLIDVRSGVIGSLSGDVNLVADGGLGLLGNGGKIVQTGGLIRSVEGNVLLLAGGSDAVLGFRAGTIELGGNGEISSEWGNVDIVALGDSLLGLQGGKIVQGDGHRIFTEQDGYVNLYAQSSTLGAFANGVILQGGDASIETWNGAITLTAEGAGGLLFPAQGGYINQSGNARIRSFNDGTVSLAAGGGVGPAGLGGTIVQTDNSLIQTENGTISLLAVGGLGAAGVGGLIYQDPGAQIVSVNGDILLTALGGIGLGGFGGTIVQTDDGLIQNTNGKISLFAGGGVGLLGTGGVITQSGDAQMINEFGLIELVAEGGLGIGATGGLITQTGNAKIHNQFGNVQIVAGGGLGAGALGGLIVQAGNAEIVNQDGSIVLAAGGGVGALATGGAVTQFGTARIHNVNGNIDLLGGGGLGAAALGGLVAQGGDAEIVNQNGNIRLFADGGEAGLAAGGAVVQGGSGLIQNTNGKIVLRADGGFGLLAGGGAIIQQDGAEIINQDGIVRLVANGGEGVLAGGGFINQTGDALIRTRDGRITLRARGGVGVAAGGGFIEQEGAAVIRSRDGNIRLFAHGGDGDAATGGTIHQHDDAQIFTTRAGNIRLSAFASTGGVGTGGTIVQTDNAKIQAKDTGFVALLATGRTGEFGGFIQQNDDALISTDIGLLTLTTTGQGGTIEQNDSGDIRSNSGDIKLASSIEAGGTDGRIDLNGGRVKSNTGHIWLDVGDGKSFITQGDPHKIVAVDGIITFTGAGADTTIDMAGLTEATNSTSDIAIVFQNAGVTKLGDIRVTNGTLVLGSTNVALVPGSRPGGQLGDTSQNGKTRIFAKNLVGDSTGFADLTNKNRIDNVGPYTTEQFFRLVDVTGGLNIIGDVLSKNADVRIQSEGGDISIQANVTAKTEAELKNLDAAIVQPTRTVRVTADSIKLLAATGIGAGADPFAAGILTTGNTLLVENRFGAGSNGIGVINDNKGAASTVTSLSSLIGDVFFEQQGGGDLNLIQGVLAPNFGTADNFTVNVDNSGGTFGDLNIISTTIIAGGDIKLGTGSPWDTLISNSIINAGKTLFGIAENNMTIQNNSALSSNLGTTLVMDDQNPVRPGIGLGSFILAANSTITSGQGPLAIFTARQGQNSILGSLNGSFLNPLPFNNPFERFATYWGDPGAFGGFPFIVYYKEPGLTIAGGDDSELFDDQVLRSGVLPITYGLLYQSAGPTAPEGTLAAASSFEIAPDQYSGITRSVLMPISLPDNNTPGFEGRAEAYAQNVLARIQPAAGGQAPESPACTELSEAAARGDLARVAELANECATAAGPTTPTTPTQLLRTPSARPGFVVRGGF